MVQRICLGSGLLVLAIVAGCVISPRRDTTVSGGGGGGGGTQGKLYVTNEAGNAILRFNGALTATGNIAPAATIAGSATQILTPQYLFVDAQADRLFVADLGGSAVLVFENASTKTGNIAPNRTIAGAGTLLAQPSDVTVDRGKDLLYVADSGSILVFAAASTVNGNTPPVRTITPSPALTIGAIFLDATNDRLYVADTSNAVDVFDGASTLNGTVAPPRRLTGAATQLGQPQGLLVDSAGRLIVSNVSPASIAVFNNAATITGNIAPVGFINGGNTTLVGPTQITLNPNATGGDLFVADGFAGEVAVFSNIAAANGNIAPARNINGSNTNLARTGGATAKGVALDTTR